MAEVLSLDDLAPDVPTGSPAQTTQAPQDPQATSALDDLTDEVQSAPSTAGDKAIAVGQGVVAGVAQTAPVVAGGFAGAKIGATVGAFVPPQAVTVPLFTAIGLGAGITAGFFAGRELQSGLATVQIPGTDETLTFESMEAVPKELRPFAVAGETFGGSLAPMRAPYKLARDGVVFADNLVGRFFNRIIDGAARAPKTFLAAELSAASSAATLEGVAEEVDPGAVGTRIGFGLVGGVLNPTRWLIVFGRGAFTRSKQLIQAFSASARENKAAKILHEIVTEAGEDPLAIARGIRQRMAEFPDVVTTAAQMSDSPVLRAIEATLVRESAKFGGDSRAMAQEGLRAFRTMIAALQHSGSPAALREAARMRQDYFHALLATRLQIAETRALEAAVEIKPGNAKSLTDYGKKVGEIMDEAMSEVRALEREAYSKVDDTLAGDAGGMFARYRDLKAGMLPEEKLPDIIEGFIERIRANAKSVFNEAGEVVPATTVGELRLIRSRMLAKAREAAAKNEWSDARAFGELAEAALDDLARIDGGPDLDVARQLSFDIHETFSRTFAGETLARAGSGARRIPPEVIMQRALAGGPEMKALHFRQLEEAARMAGIEHVSRLVDLQERTIRFAASEIVDTVTGRVNPKRLGDFLRKNAELLDRFPEVRAQIETAQKAELFLRRTETGVRRAERAIEQRAAFSKLLKGEDPAVAVGRALRGPNPIRDFNAIAKVAKRAGPDAVEGLKASIFADAYQRASLKTSGGFSFEGFARAFDEPLITGGPSLRALMLKNGLGSADDFKMLDRFLDRAMEIERALATREPLDRILSQDDALFDLVLRIGGARAAAIAPTGGAHGLIVAGAASRFARQVFDKLPKASIREITINAFKNPEIMAALLERATTQAQKVRIALQMNAWLWQMGVTARPIDQEPTEETAFQDTETGFPTPTTPLPQFPQRTAPPNPLPLPGGA